MVRPLKVRKLYMPHPAVTFTPLNTDTTNKEKVTLLSEEYQALRLTDYEYLNHAQAAKIMGISRPTFTRIYEKARQKIATALTEIRILEVQEGNTVLSGSWYECDICGSKFTIPSLEYFNKLCPICNSENIKKI